jgi:tRNA(His) guanylyltransferase
MDFLSNYDKDNCVSNSDEKLGDRMKGYEKIIDYKIKPSESYVIRLDGRSFSKFTKKFVKPFDLVFVKAMCMTMQDLVEEFEAQTGYTHSDEITLIFNAKCTELEEFEYLETKIYKECKRDSEKDAQTVRTSNLKELPIHMFKGRIQKILSLVSSYCSVRFNYHLSNLIEPIKTNYDDKFVELIKSYRQMFDSRIMIFEEKIKHEILNHQIWRSIHDCERNAISTYAYTYFGSKKIMNKNCKEMIQMMKDEKNLDWDWDRGVPTFIKHGVYCKKNLVYKEINGLTVLKSYYVLKELKINFSQDNLNLMVRKYWNSLNDDSGEIIDSSPGNILNLDTISL